MTVYELNRDQIIELKQSYLTGKKGESLSYEELSHADTLVSDNDIFNEYSCTDFTEDDFFCSSNNK